MKIGVYTGEEKLKNAITEKLDSYEVVELFTYSIKLIDDQEIDSIVIYEEMVSEISAEVIANDIRQNELNVVILIKKEKTGRINEFIDVGIYNLLTGTFKTEEIENLLIEANSYKDIEHLHSMKNGKRKIRKTKSPENKDAEQKSSGIWKGVFGKKKDSTQEKSNDIRESDEISNLEAFAFTLDSTAETGILKNSENTELLDITKNEISQEEEYNILIESLQDNTLPDLFSEPTKIISDKEEEAIKERKTAQKAKEEADRLAKEEVVTKERETAQTAKEEADRLAKEEVVIKERETAQKTKEEADRLVKEEQDIKKEEETQKAKKETERLAKEEARRQRESIKKAQVAAEKAAKEEKQKQKSKEKAKRIALVKEEARKTSLKTIQAQTLDENERLRYTIEEEESLPALVSEGAEGVELDNNNVDKEAEKLNISNKLSFKGLFRKQTSPMKTDKKNQKKRELPTHTTIGVMGTDSAVGCTHTALLICSTYSKTSKVAYVDMTSNRKSNFLKQQFGLNEKKDVFRVKGVTFYTGERVFKDVEKYDLIVFDFGDYKSCNNQLSFNMARKKIIVSDSNLYNKKALLKFCKAYSGTYKDYTYILRTASKTEMHTYKEYLDSNNVFTIGHEKQPFNPSNETMKQISKTLRR